MIRALYKNRYSYTDLIAISLTVALFEHFGLVSWESLFVFIAYVAVSLLIDNIKNKLAEKL